MLYNAILLGANLTGAHIAAKLGGMDKTLAANLTYAFLKHTIIDSADLSGVDFSFATLIGTSFTAPKVLLEQASFANAYLENVTFGSNPVLRGTNFANTCLINCNLTGADLRRAPRGASRPSWKAPSSKGPCSPAPASREPTWRTPWLPSPTARSRPSTATLTASHHPPGR